MKCVIEIAKGSRNKYEIKDGKIYLDRVIDQPYPENYGYVPNSLAEDGDALDIFVISDEPIITGATVDVDVVAMVDMIDNGYKDNKLIGFISGSEQNSELDIAQIIKFLETYKPGVLVGPVKLYNENVETYIKERMLCE